MIAFIQRILRIVKQIFLLIIIFFSLVVMGKFLYSGTYVKHHNRKMLEAIRMENPTYFNRFDKFIQEIETTTDWRVHVTSGFRTAEEQAELHDEDARNARSGKSKHNLAKAIDMNLYPAHQVWGGWLRKNTPKKAWEMSGIMPIAQKHGLKWGGHFKTYYDPVHFEIP
jgi:D-alanyl-D-alanine carboxypeptidase